MTQQFCEQCGAPLPADARFCEQCGSPVAADQPSRHPERTIGHIPLRFEETGRGRFGRAKTTNFELVVTNVRLLFLRGGFLEDDVWLGEQEEVEWQAESSGAPLREVVESYDLCKELWQPLYTTPPEQMLAWHKANHALLLDGVSAATVTLDPEGVADTLALRLIEGAELDFMIYLTMGKSAAKFLQEALGWERVDISR
jgi:hypothetical protein